MRPDMAKVLVERERIKPYHGDGYGQVRALLDRQDPEEAISYSPMRKLHKDTKQLNENLSPLRRFLESKRGQRWDDIYSEMRQNINPGNEVQNHILSHLDNYVELDCVTLENGNVIRSNGENVPYYIKFYVDQSGILKENKRKFNLKKKDKKDIITIGHMKEAEKIEGIWYIIEYAQISYKPIKDVITHETVYLMHIPSHFVEETLGKGKWQIKFVRFVSAYNKVVGTPYKLNNQYYFQIPNEKSWIAISKKQMNKKIGRAHV